MNVRLRRLAHPLDRYGGYFAPHVLLLGVILGVFLGVSGVLVEQGVRQYTASYFEHRFKAPLKVPTATHALPFSPRANAQPSFVIPLKNLLPGVGFQDGTGSCAAWATDYYSLSYQWRLSHPGSFLKFSPRFPYDLAVNDHFQGQDYGSNVAWDSAHTSDYGLPRFNDFPYGDQMVAVSQAHGDSLPPYGVDNPVPQWAYPLASKQRFATSVQVVQGDALGGGIGLVQALKSSLSDQKLPVPVAIPVWPEFDGATSTSGFVGPPTDEEVKSQPQGRGGHQIVFLGYNDTYQGTTSDGRHYTGAFLFVTSWGKNYGVSLNGKTSLGHMGYGYMAYDMVGQWAFDAELPLYKGTLGSVRLPLGHWPAPVVQPGTQAKGYFVGSVPAKDSPVDLGPLVNRASRTYHLEPRGLLAMIGSECGLHTHSPTCDRNYGVLADTSFGSCQVSVPTAAFLGVGDGSWDAIPFVRNYENNPHNCIHLAGKYLAWIVGIEKQRCPGATHFPALDVAWNAGPYQSCGFLLYPSGQAYTNHLNFLSWYRWAQTR